VTLINSRSVRGRCPVCGGEHVACGPPSRSVPFDQRMEVAAVGEPLQEYEVTLPGGRKTTMKLNASDAERYGVLEGASGDRQESAGEASAEDTSAKSRTTSRNKARTASDKGDA
jgi:hypothetical protein